MSCEDPETLYLICKLIENLMTARYTLEKCIINELANDWSCRTIDKADMTIGWTGLTVEWADMTIGWTGLTVEWS
jgi:hypothetical protein